MQNTSRLLPDIYHACMSDYGYGSSDLFLNSGNLKTSIYTLNTRGSHLEMV